MPIRTGIVSAVIPKPIHNGSRWHKHRQVVGLRYDVVIHIGMAPLYLFTKDPLLASWCKAKIGTEVTLHTAYEWWGERIVKVDLERVVA